MTDEPGISHSEGYPSERLDRYPERNALWPVVNVLGDIARRIQREAAVTNPGVEGAASHPAIDRRTCTTRANEPQAIAEVTQEMGEDVGTDEVSTEI